MKKFAKRLLVGSLMSATALSFLPTRSEAAIGLAIGNIPLAVVGGGVAVLGFVTFEAEIHKNSDEAIMGAVGGFWLMVIGAVLLDDRGAITPHFTAIQASDANQIGLSARELEAFNDPANLLRLNAILNTITARTKDLALKSGVTSEEIDHFIQDQWNEKTANLDPDLASAREKVSHGIASTLMGN